MRFVFRFPAYSLFFGLSGALCLQAQSAAKVDFQKDIAPVFEQYCVQCHHAGNEKADLELSSRKDLLDHHSVIPGNPDRSVLYTMMRDGLMPPGKKMDAAALNTVRLWIAQGAVWPDDVKLSIKKPESAAAAPGSAGGEMENVRAIHDRIVANSKTHPMAKGAYKVTIPHTTVSYDMVPIPAGTFTMGSPDSDPQKKKDEQPARKITLDGFGMQAHEVTWDEYRLFMFANQAQEAANKDAAVDAISRPTRPYVEMSFGMGINGYPAISMTQHAANKYAEWLSAKTGEFYRLPTEAEWEYACRAGTGTPYFFGDSATSLGDYAWFSTNSGGKYQKVATKKPNPWGLYDILGNVGEWTLDQYDSYQPGEQKNPWVKATTPYPQVVRGGSWNDGADMLRCAARLGSDESWKQQDPQLPKSIWYLTDAQWLGFRLIRPNTVPPAEEMFKYWNNGVEHDEQ